MASVPARSEVYTGHHQPGGERGRLPHPEERAGPAADLAQLPHRVEAHILVCFLAYVLWKTLEQWQQRAGLGHSPRTILEELHRIHSTDIVLPTEDDRELRLRCVVRPDTAQATLLDRLGLELPERLRISPRLAEPASV